MIVGGVGPTMRRDVTISSPLASTFNHMKELTEAENIDLHHRPSTVIEWKMPTKSRHQRNFSKESTLVGSEAYSEESASSISYTYRKKNNTPSETKSTGLFGSETASSISYTYRKKTNAPSEKSSGLFGSEATMSESGSMGLGSAWGEDESQFRVADNFDFDF